MPWKNGGGTTFEVALHPEDADWASFVWRISIAQVERGGPFSSFAGIDRSLVVLAGQGMVLRGIRAHPIDVRLYDCVAFAGEATVDTELLGGPTRDFNLMTRRGVAQADVRVLQGAQGAMEGVATYVCHAASRSCQCGVDGTSVDVPEGHTLVADGVRFDVDASRDAVAVVARVTQ